MKSKTPDSLFGKELERLRHALSDETGEAWTQKMVADAVGVTTQAYQNWIHGRRGKNIDVATLKKLGEVLNTDLKKLIKLARPDILEFVQVIYDEEKTKSGRSFQKTTNGIIYPPDVVYVANILKMLYINNREEFNKVRRIVSDFYPDIANKTRKRTKK